jgi:hypothetical protein
LLSNLGPSSVSGARGKITTGEPTVAVLIDADNTPHHAVKYILDASARLGRVIVRRAYGDWTTPILQPWGTIFRDFAVKPVQQFQYTTRKNSTDVAMIIDALDILHDKSIDIFMLVTSDSDFTALATRIREEGIGVVGVGRSTTPSSFVKGCDQFILIETILPSNEKEQLPTSQEGGESMGGRPTLGDIRAQGKDLLMRAAKQSNDAEGIVLGSFLGILLKRLDPSFAPSNYGVEKLAEFIGLFPDISPHRQEIWLGSDIQTGRQVSI